MRRWFHRVRYGLGTLACVAGGGILVGIVVYRLGWRPEWTGPESLQALWPLYVAGAVLLVIGVMILPMKAR